MLAAYQKGDLLADESDVGSQWCVERWKLPRGRRARGVAGTSSPRNPSARVCARRSQWLTIVKWVHFAMLDAEELGVSSKTIEQALKSEKPNVLRLVGTDGNYGEQLSLKNDWAANIIDMVGNYGEVYERNVGTKSKLGIPRGLKNCGPTAASNMRRRSVRRSRATTSAAPDRGGTSDMIVRAGPGVSSTADYAEALSMRSQRWIEIPPRRARRFTSAPGPSWLISCAPTIRLGRTTGWQPSGRRWRRRSRRSNTTRDEGSDAARARRCARRRDQIRRPAPALPPNRAGSATNTAAALCFRSLADTIAIIAGVAVAIVAAGRLRVRIVTTESARVATRANAVGANPVAADARHGRPPSRSRPPKPQEAANRHPPSSWRPPRPPRNPKSWQSAERGRIPKPALRPAATMCTTAAKRSARTLIVIKSQTCCIRCAPRRWRCATASPSGPSTHRCRKRGRLHRREG